MMVDLGGLEPPTSPLSGVHSNQLSYRSSVILKNEILQRFNLKLCLRLRFLCQKRYNPRLLFESLRLLFTNFYKKSLSGSQ